MSSEKIRIRYDGPALAKHSIDVDELAPALLALGDLCKLANNKFNGNRATIKVFVSANVEQNCFELNLELIQTLVSQIKSITSDEDVAAVKDLLEWLGIIVAVSVPTVMGLFKFLKTLGGRKIESIEPRTKEDGNVVQVKIEGDNNRVHVHSNTIELLKEPRVAEKFKKTIKPLAQEGYETLEFESDDGRKEEITKEEAKKILDVEAVPQLLLIEDDAPQMVTAWITVYSPVYEINAKNWRFEYGGRHEVIDISETNIAEKAIRRGGALVNDTYKVVLEITQTKTPTGKYKNHYKIKEVVEFHPAQFQEDMFDEDQF